MKTSDEFCKTLIQYLVENKIIKLNETTNEQLVLIIQEYINSTK